MQETKMAPWGRIYTPAVVLSSVRNFLMVTTAILVAGGLFLLLFAPAGANSIVLTELQKNCASVARQILH